MINSINVLQKTFELTKKYVQKNSNIKNLYHWINKGERLISRNDFFENRSNEEPINKSNKNFNTTYNKLIPEANLNIDKNISSVIGWVPYIKNRTNVFLFHFFSINYGLRKNLLIRVSLIKGLNIIKQNCFWFPIFGLQEIDLINLWNGLDGDTVYVEMFHQRIPKNHGGGLSVHRFHGKYYNSNKINTCVVHSAPIDKKSKYLKKAIWGRKIISINDNEKNFHFSRGYRVNVEKNNYEEFKTQFGYNMITDENMNPLSVWHSCAHSPQSLREADQNTKRTTQGFWCPPTNLLDPLLFIDHKETELISNCINFYLIDGINIKKKKTINVSGLFSMKVSEIFGEKVPGPYLVICEFSYNHHGYLNISYNSTKSTGDCVHAWTCHWKIDGDKIIPVSTTRGNNGGSFALLNSRKFFDFKKKENKNEFNYFMININKMENNINNTNSKFALRLFLDNENEYVKFIKVNFKEPIQVFDIDEMFNLKDKENFKNGIVQLESIYSNFYAYLLRFDSDTGITAIDHFTGG